MTLFESINNKNITCSSLNLLLCVSRVCMWVQTEASASTASQMRNSDHQPLLQYLNVLMALSLCPFHWPFHPQSMSAAQQPEAYE